MSNHVSQFSYYTCFRLADAVGGSRSNAAFRSEALLLTTYAVRLPTKQHLSSIPGAEDKVSVDILQQLAPATLTHATPREIFGDGNCMYRALSLGLYGTQDHHLHLRLRAALEMNTHPEYYDTKHLQYQDLIKEDHIERTVQFVDLVKSTVTVGSYAGMEKMHAVSAALRLGLASYYPPSTANNYNTAAYTRKVYGRGVTPSKGIHVTVMWTQTVRLSDVHRFRPNHFVLLAAKNRPSPPLVDLTGSKEPSLGAAGKRRMESQIVSTKASNMNHVQIHTGIWWSLYNYIVNIWSMYTVGIGNSAHWHLAPSKQIDKAILKNNFVLG